MRRGWANLQRCYSKVPNQEARERQGTSNGGGGEKNGSGGDTTSRVRRAG